MRARLLATTLVGTALIAPTQAIGADELEYRAAPGRVVVMHDTRSDSSFFIDTVHALPDGGALVAGTTFRGSAPGALIMRLRADGSLDRAYGERGAVRLDGMGLVGLVGAPGGGAVVALSTDTLGDGPLRSRLVRLDPQGRPDGGFGAGGAIELPGLETLAVARAPGDAIVLGGLREGKRGAAVRITAAGAIDPAFGASGDASITPPESLAVAPDGSVLVLAPTPGCDTEKAACDLALLRYDAAGALDPSFAGQGFARLPLHYEDGAVAQDAQGRYWVYGLRPTGDGNALVRLLPDGRRDPSFSSEASMPALASESPGLLQLTPEGPLVVTHSPDEEEALLVRIGEDGALTSVQRTRARFGGGDIERPEATGRLGDALDGTAVAFRPDGVALLAGTVSIERDSVIDTGTQFRRESYAGIAALRPGGGLESSFGRATRPPRVDLRSARRDRRAIILRLRTETRGIARVVVRHRDRVIARRMVAFFAPGTIRAHAELGARARRLLRRSARVTITVVANDLAGNVRRLRERRRL